MFVAASLGDDFGPKLTAGPFILPHLLCCLHFKIDCIFRGHLMTKYSLILQHFKTICILWRLQQELTQDDVEKNHLQQWRRSFGLYSQQNLAILSITQQTKQFVGKYNPTICNRGKWHKLVIRIDNNHLMTFNLPQECCRASRFYKYCFNMRLFFFATQSKRRSGSTDYLKIKDDFHFPLQNIKYSNK